MILLVLGALVQVGWCKLGEIVLHRLRWVPNNDIICGSFQLARIQHTHSIKHLGISVRMQVGTQFFGPTNQLWSNAIIVHFSPPIKLREISF